LLANDNGTLIAFQNAEVNRAMKSNLFVAAGIGILFLLPQAAAFGQTENSPADATSSRSE
jgi:hypothetical protein